MGQATKRTTLIAAAVILLALLGATAAQAGSVITYEIGGQFSAPAGTFADGFTPMPVDFLLTVSGDADEWDGTGTFFTYTALSATLAFPAAAVPAITLANTTIYVEATAGGGDFFRVNADTTYNAAQFPGTNGIGLFSVFLSDSTSTAFADASLPATLGLGDFDTLTADIRFGDAGGADPFGDTYTGAPDDVTVTVDDNGTVIPTPAALPAGVALLSLLALRRRQPS